MEKHKVLLSFVEKAAVRSPSQEIVALTADGKRLVRLQPEHQLIGVLTEKNRIESVSSRRQIRIEPEEANDENASKSGDETTKRDKIPRPANAFMLFANEWRKKLAVEYPRESNKDISVRLGVLWKTMSKDAKEKYFALARKVDAEHKRKYPDYVYNPKEARLRKAMREQSRSQPVSGPVSSRVTSNGQQGAGPNRMIGPWFPLGHTSQPATHPKPILSPRVMAAHQRTLDKDAMRKQLQDCGNGAFLPSSAYRSEYGEFEGQQQKWHPYQNGAYHSRGALMPKINRAMQTPAWGQFCNAPFPTSQSVAMQQRGNRHMVFLQEQSGYPSAETPYDARSSYSQEQVQPQEDSKTEEAPRWTTPPSSSSSCTPDGLLESNESTPRQTSSKQPLPGFQQAFGSTEIGRFSRSELFASLVEAVNLIPTKSLLKSRTADPSRPDFSRIPIESEKAQEWPTEPPPAHSQNKRPTEEKLDGECLDLRVPSRKKSKIEEKKGE